MARYYGPPRMPKITADVEKILAAINAYMPATSHHSWALSRELGIGSGSYWKIGGLKVPAHIWNSILADNSITMAHHYQERWKGGRFQKFNERMIKSRFGETKVSRYFGGAVNWTDNEQAREFYNEQSQRAIEEIVGHADTGDLATAIATKRRLKRELGI